MLIIFLLSLFPIEICKAHNYNYQFDKRYGHAQNEGFVNAIYGLNQNITPEEIEQIGRLKLIVIENKFFLRLGANTGSSYLINIKNISSKQIIKDAVVANDKQTNSPKRSLEAAFGYRANKLYTEIELLITQNIKYDRLQLFNNQNGSLNSIIKSNALFINGYYDFIKLKKLSFFVGVGIGAGVINTDSKFFNSVLAVDEKNFKKSNITGAFNVTLGCHFRMASQLLIKTAIRYVNFAGINNMKIFSFGNMIWKNGDLNLYLKGQHRFVGFGLSIIHVIC